VDVVSRRIERDGIDESQWQDSPWLQSLPRQEPGALLAGIERLVVVSPHPDDEVLACGGLMASAHRHGVAVLVISVTDGEACYPDQAAWPPARLREVRQQELARALACLGLVDVQQQAWHVDDGAVVRQEAALVERLHGVLRAGDLLLAPWRLDAHPDHEAVGRACAQAAALRGCVLREFPVWGWHWLDPQGAATCWSPATRFPLSAELQRRKRDAIDQFATQTGAVEGLACAPILPETVLRRFRRSFEVLIG